MVRYGIFRSSVDPLLIFRSEPPKPDAENEVPSVDENNNETLRVKNEISDIAIGAAISPFYVPNSRQIRPQNSPPTGFKIGHNGGDNSGSLLRVDKFLVEFAERERYNTSTVNGQRTLGPPIGMESRVIEYTHELYVGNVPQGCFEDELVPLFAKYGMMFTFRFMLNFNGQNRGYAFVKYVQLESAELACKELNGYPIREFRKLRVAKCRNNNVLFVGTFSVRQTHPCVVLDRFAQTLHGLKKVTLFRPTDFGRFTFLLEFFTHSDTALSRRQLIADDELFPVGSKYIVDWYPRAIPRTDPQVSFEWANIEDSSCKSPKLTFYQDKMPVYWPCCR